MLLSHQGTIKLCDFGSATTISHYPDYSWSAQRRALVEDEVSGVGVGPVRTGESDPGVRLPGPSLGQETLNLRVILRLHHSSHPKTASYSFFFHCIVFVL